MLKAETLIHDTGMPQVQPIEGVPVRVDVAFSDPRGVEKKSIRKNAEKALKNLAPALHRLLARDEFVLYLAGACAPMRGLEQYTFGHFAQIVNRVVLVFTNQRLLALRVDASGKWKQSQRACALGDIRSAKLSGWLVRFLKLQYANGKKESYSAIKMRDGAKLKVLVPKLLEANAGSQTHLQAMQPLCPNCAAPLTARQYECSSCGQKFRDESSLWWRVLLPGGGYFFARQTGMGLVHALVDSLFLLAFLGGTLAVFTAPARERTQDFWVGYAIFAGILIFERLIALSHTRRFIREFIPIAGTAHSDRVRAAGA